MSADLFWSACCLLSIRSITFTPAGGFPPLPFVGKSSAKAPQAVPVPLFFAVPLLQLLPLNHLRPRGLRVEPKNICLQSSRLYIAAVLQKQRRHFNKLCRPAISGLLVAVILFLNAMAACPALHQLIHHDANQPGHECAVTIFAHGKVEAATVEVSVTAAAILIAASPQIEISVFSTAIENLPPGRAPPAVVSSLA
jgi:hypothetical protein